MNGYYLNELVAILEEKEDSYLVQYEDGFTEEAPKEEVTVFKTNGLKRSRVNPYNKERRQKKLKKNFGSPERREAVSNMECVVPECTAKGNNHNAHVTARGMGGSNSSKDEIVPLCFKHHNEQGRIGIISFQDKYNVNLTQEAARVAEELKDYS